LKQKLKLRPGIAIFIIFLGIAFFEAIRMMNWISVAFWLMLAIAFPLLDKATKVETE
jgi:hypothetical protein